eukprot:gnl/MRDRNA2_/MRDRNA2_174197_c0_seq1.p1 gnl/MRDRNA2_/MRDRNA2_174197_c0~~gnl/MRDRNA2_/MRDRNA2_174197_c0_seq1.p1  ORF type:complete len:384 (+),score=89.03 gnl/MRDRNA2_/MRDRNA2_174197_c0_seq1:37-1188(+)
MPVNEQEVDDSLKMPADEASSANDSYDSETRLYALVERLLTCEAVIALPISERYQLAGQVAEVPACHATLTERLLDGISNCSSEGGALNALYVLETWRELVPGFARDLPVQRLELAAENSCHLRVQDAVLQGKRPSEWDMAEQAPSIVLQDSNLPYEAGGSESAGDNSHNDVFWAAQQAVSKGVHVVSSGARTLSNAMANSVPGSGASMEDESRRENAFGDRVQSAVDTVTRHIDSGLHTAQKRIVDKGVMGAVTDATVGTVDLLHGFVGKASGHVAGGVTDVMDWVAPVNEQIAVVEVDIEVPRLIGTSGTLGLRIDGGAVVGITAQQAEEFGWRTGDHILAVNDVETSDQAAVLSGIVAAKKALLSNHLPMRFRVARQSTS